MESGYINHKYILIFDICHIEPMANRFGSETRQNDVIQSNHYKYSNYLTTTCIIYTRIYKLYNDGIIYTSILINYNYYIEKGVIYLFTLHTLVIPFN